MHIHLANRHQSITVHLHLGIWRVDVLARKRTVMHTGRHMKRFFFFLFFFLAPGKPTGLRVTSVHNLTITLTWNKPLTTAGTPISSSLFYNVRYTAIGSGSGLRKSVSTESVQLPLRANTQYNIFVKAIRSNNHQIQGEWSRNFRVDSKDLGKFVSP